MRFRLFLAALALPHCLVTPLRAQVGHPPQSSPYRDIIFSNSLTAQAGHLSGDGGDIGIGPHNGYLYGARFDHRLSSIIQMALSFETGTMERLIIDADDPVDSRVTGPVDQSLTMVEAVLQWNITGRKTWHHLAPYVGGSIGIVWAGDTPADTSGYNFGTRAVLAPNLGVRLYAGQRLHLRAEVRWPFWQLKYPSSYFQEPADDPGTILDPHAVLVNHKDTEWTSGTELKLGLGISF